MYLGPGVEGMGVGVRGSVKEEAATYPKPFEEVESWNLVIDRCGA